MKKRCLVLGGGSDIGSAIVRTLHTDYDVIWTYWNTWRDQPGDGIQVDITDLDQLARLFSRIKELDVMVTAAFPFIEGNNLDFNAYLRAKAFETGHIYAMIEAAKRMNGGTIVNMLGQCVERGLPGGAAYSAAFAAIHNYGASINGREGKEGKVQVLDFLLGPVNTREWHNVSAEMRARYEAEVLAFIEPQQIADLVQVMVSQPVVADTLKLAAHYGYGAAKKLD